MTRQESFKKRIRTRMAKTGERYVAARRALLDAEQAGGRPWVAPPEVGNDAVVRATGRDWDQWCDVIDAWTRHTDGHAAIAVHLESEHGLDGWWAQTVTVGYERIVGLRLPHQRPDGTFTASKSRTVAVDPDALRAMLLSDEDRGDLFPGVQTEVRSRPTAKAIRIEVGAGVAVFGLTAKPDGRTTVTVAHERLPTATDVDEWKFYWSEWLDAIDDA